MEWVAFSFSRGSSQPTDGTQVSYIAGRFFASWATREAHPMRYMLFLFKFNNKETEAQRALVTCHTANKQQKQDLKVVGLESADS